MPTFWPTYDETDREYMVLRDQPYVAEETEEMIEAYQFWSEEWPTLAADPEEDEDFPGLGPLPTFETPVIPL